MDAVTLFGTSLQHASADLRADREIVMAAVKRQGIALSYANEALCKDRGIVLTAVADDGGALAYASQELRADREVVLVAARNRAIALRYAHPALRADKELILEVTQRHTDGLKYASNELRVDKNFVQQIVRNNGEALEFADVSLKADRDVVVAAVHNCAKSLYHAVDEMRRDKDLVLLAARRWNSSVEWLLDFAVQASIPDEMFQPAVQSVIAVRGEENALLVTATITLIPDTTGHGDSSEIVLLSGASFVWHIADEGTLQEAKRFPWRRSHPRINDLALIILEDLPQYAEMHDAARVFISIMTDDDGTAKVVTPWEWDRPLREFVR